MLLISLASLFSPTVGDCRAFTTVCQVQGDVCLFFHVVNTEIKHFWESNWTKHDRSPSDTFNTMPTCCHLLGITAATSFMRSESSGSLFKPAGYLLRKSVKEGLTQTRIQFQNGYRTQCRCFNQTYKSWYTCNAHQGKHQAAYNF